MLSVQQSPNDKSGLGFNSNNKNKSKSKSNKKKGQDKVKDPAKLVCFKCKVEGHHVRSCPLKKKKHLSEKQQGKRPQGQGQAHARPQVEDRPLPKKNQDIVPQEKKSIKKRKGNTCYLCRVKGHFASSCLSGTLSNPIIVDNDYSLGKDKDGNVFAKFVGTQSGFKKRTIWVAKPIVTNLLGPNLVGDQQAQTKAVRAIFSEFDETKTKPPIFPGRLQNTEEESERGRGPPHHRRRGLAGPAPACGGEPQCPPRRLFAYKIPFDLKTPYLLTKLQKDSRGAATIAKLQFGGQNSRPGRGSAPEAISINATASIMLRE
ncbi:hypothetical protein QYE76_041522 [Lolium multiflorum]|uniref:CCHC-type domain-containing protein n=1 Tax=Lolium multiflorum TaxID=4521 RepID=A0AAD8WU84_LOLMU|nr:hypothetical protein QYE76_041522 [Lolium multiflorum]